MQSRRNTVRALVRAALLLCVACFGCQSSPADEGDQAAAVCRADLPDTLGSNELPDVWGLRRLTRTELIRTFDALVGVVPESVRRLPVDEGDLSTTAPAPSSFEVDLFRQMASEAADAGSSELLARWGCERDGRCLRAAVVRWLERAYREPLTRRERYAHLALFTDGENPRPALRGLLELVFQSPRFLYVIERGIPRRADEESRELTAWELATRLSYFLWSEPPDDALRDEAERGRLSDPLALQAQARRLVADPKAARTIGAALQQWMAPELDIVAKAESVYPEFSPKLRASMREQFVRFAALAIAEQYDLAQLLTTERAPLDPRLQALLGVERDDEDDGDGADWNVAELEPPRFGLLTLPGVLTANARADDSSPIQRGLLIRRKLLCQSVAPPPPGVARLAAGETGVSFRERFEEHTSNPVCAGCHELMDPLGYPFEIYDGLGRLRDDLATIRTAGKLNGVTAPTGFADLNGLVDALIGAPEVSRCWAQQWMQRALGPEAARDEALLDRLATKVADGTPLTELIVEIVTAPGFGRVRRPAAE